MPYDYQKEYQCGPEKMVELMYLIIKQKPIKSYLAKHPKEVNKSIVVCVARASGASGGANMFCYEAKRSSCIHRRRRVVL